MLDLHVPKIIAHVIKRVASLRYPFSFLIQSIQEISFLEGVIMEICPCLFHTFHVRASYFLLI